MSRIDNLRKFIYNLVKGKFAQSAFLYTISSFINSETPFLLLPILTLYLSVEEYGIISMFNASASILVPFMGMSISSAVLRKFSERKQIQIKNIFLMHCLFLLLHLL